MLGLYALAMAKVLLYSLPLLALILLINVAPLVADNLADQRPALAQTWEPAQKGLILWALFSTVMLVVSSLRFWRAVGKGAA